MPPVMETWCQTARHYICRFSSNFDLFTAASFKRHHEHGTFKALQLVHATCMWLMSNLHATCRQDHDCNFCNWHEHLNHTICNTRFYWWIRTSITLDKHTLQIHFREHDWAHQLGACSAWRFYLSNDSKLLLNSIWLFWSCLCKHRLTKSVLAVDAAAWQKVLPRHLFHTRWAR